MNKRRLTQVSIVSLLLAGTTAWADTMVTSMRVMGNTVTATFSSFDPLDPCMETFVSVVAADLIEKDKPGGKTVFVNNQLTVVQSDRCTGLLLFNGDGASMSPPVQVAGDLSSASVTTSVEVFDNVFQLSETFQINLTWTATSRPETSKIKEEIKDKELGLKIKTVSKSTHVEASATGTAIGMGQNVAPEPSESATIQKSNDGFHMVQRTN